jgi:hypothetical protein
MNPPNVFNYMAPRFPTSLGQTYQMIDLRPMTPVLWN